MGTLSFWVHAEHPYVVLALGDAELAVINSRPCALLQRATIRLADEVPVDRLDAAAFTIWLESSRMAQGDGPIPQ